MKADKRNQSINKNIQKKTDMEISDKEHSATLIRLKSMSGQEFVSDF